MMVLVLQSSRGLHVLRPKDASRWLEAHECGGPYPDDYKLDDFLSLYKKIKSDTMLMYVDSQKFNPLQGTQGHSVKLLDRLRNDFIHVSPRIWAFELEGLPSMSKDCLDVAEFLARKSNNVAWSEEGFIERATIAFQPARWPLVTI